MSGKQSLIAFIGGALILANLVSNRNAQQTGAANIINTIFSQGASSQTLSGAHSEFLGIAAELAVLIFLIVVAGTSDNVANIAMVFIIGLATVWALTNYGGLSNALGNTGRSQGHQTAA